MPSANSMGFLWPLVPGTLVPHHRRFFSPADSQRHGQDRARVPGGCGGEARCC